MEKYGGLTLEELAKAYKDSEPIRDLVKEILSLREKVSSLEDDNEILEIIARSGDTPGPFCSHPSRYHYSPNGGKNIWCLLCEFEKRKKTPPPYVRLGEITLALSPNSNLYWRHDGGWGVQFQFDEGYNLFSVSELLHLNGKLLTPISKEEYQSDNEDDA